MHKDSVTYLAIFTKEKDGGYSIEIPAIQGAFTCAEEFNEGVLNCQELIGVMLSDKEVYPNDVDVEEVKLFENQKAVYINVYLPYQFSLVKEVYKNKMLTLPTWLDALAKNKNINFSRVLQEGLKKELKIKD